MIFKNIHFNLINKGTQCKGAVVFSSRSNPQYFRNQSGTKGKQSFKKNRFKVHKHFQVQLLIHVFLKNFGEQQDVSTASSASARSLAIHLRFHQYSHRLFKLPLNIYAPKFATKKLQYSHRHVSKFLELPSPPSSLASRVQA